MTELTALIESVAGVLTGALPTTLGFRPFLDPLPIDRYWLLLLLPMVVAISVVYKTIKTDRLSKIPREASVLAAQIVAFMILAALALWILTELV